jgi:CelD/BcsL family acetyltransferase involved in cellulose biosynthesis
MLSRFFGGKLAWDFFGAPPPAWWTQWDAFNERCHDAHPLLSSLMMKPLIECFAPPSLLYATCRQQSRVVAVAILTRAGGRWTIFSPSQAPLSALLTDRSIAFEAVAQSLLRALPGYGLVLDVPARDPHLRGERLPVAAYAQNASLGTTISVAASAGFGSYWDSRSKDLRKNLKRYLNRAVEAKLPAELRQVSAAQDIGAAVDRYGLLESSGWKGLEGTALHPDNAQGRLYREVMEGFAAANRGSVYELYLGERMAASRLIVRGSTMHVILKTTYSEDLKQYAPGRLLLHLILNQLLDQASVPVEFYTRANDDLLSWATSQRDLFATTVYRNTAVVLAASARRLLRSQLQSRVVATQAEAIPASNVASRSAVAPRE